MTIGKLFVILGNVLTLIGFLFRWIQINAGPIPLASLTGLQLAQGGIPLPAIPGLPPSVIPAAPILYAVPGLALLSILALVFAFGGDWNIRKVIAFIQLVLAAISILLFIFVISTVVQGLQFPLIQVNLDLGVWGTGLALFAVVLGAVLDIASPPTPDDSPLPPGDNEVLPPKRPVTKVSVSSRPSRPAGKK